MCIEQWTLCREQLDSGIDSNSFHTPSHFRIHDKIRKGEVWYLYDQNRSPRCWRTGCPQAPAYLPHALLIPSAASELPQFPLLAGHGGSPCSVLRLGSAERRQEKKWSKKHPSYTGTLLLWLFRETIFSGQLPSPSACLCQPCPKPSHIPSCPHHVLLGIWRTATLPRQLIMIPEFVKCLFLGCSRMDKRFLVSSLGTPTKTQLCYIPPCPTGSPWQKLCRILTTMSRNSACTHSGLDIQQTFAICGLHFYLLMVCSLPISSLFLFPPGHHHNCYIITFGWK